ncbi:MAG: hypothetical protein Tsb0020_53170 [Haliangiales bacterium]
MAEALFEEGRQLMDQKRYGEACRKFRASYEADESVGALLNLGDCREKNGELASAWGAFREAATLARRTGETQRQRFARSKAEELKGRLSYLTIEVSDDARVAGLTLTRSGEEVPEALWNQRVPVDPGAYVIRIEAPGYEAAELPVEVKGERDDARVTAPVLTAAAQPSGDGQPAGPTGGGGGGGGGVMPPVDSGSGGMPLGRKAAIGAGAAGAVGLIVGAVFGLEASSKWDEAKQNCVDGDLTNCNDRGVTLGDEAESRALLSTVGFAVGVVGVGAGVALWFLTPADSATAERAAQFTPLVSPDSVGATVRWRF